MIEHMQFTLRQARKLETKISDFLQAFDSRNSLVLELDPFEIDTSASQRIIRARSLAQTRIALNSLLIDVRARIRRKIQSTNEEVGINHLISERKRLNNRITYFQNLVNTTNDSVRLDVNAIQHRLDAIVGSEAKPATPSYGNLSDGVETPVLTEESVDKFQREIREMKKEIESIDEALISKNVSSYITVDGPDQTTLAEAELI